jgi:hypothetical protein
MKITDEDGIIEIGKPHAERREVNNQGGQRQPQ